MNRWLSIFSLLFFLFLNILCNIRPACAQDTMTVGEMLIYGDVFIRSSAGEWIPAPSSYPILQDSVISTKKGAVSLHFKDGSRIDLAESTIATLSSRDSHNTVHLTKGKLAVNISPESSFIFSSGVAGAVAELSNGTRGASATERFMGTVSSGAEGVAVQSISGTASLKVNGSVPKEVPSGRRTVIGPYNEINNYTTALMSSKKIKCEKKKKPKKNCSPYTFYDDFEVYCHDYD